MFKSLKDKGIASIIRKKLGYSSWQFDQKKIFDDNITKLIDLFEKVKKNNFALDRMLIDGINTILNAYKTPKDRTIVLRTVETLFELPQGRIGAALERKDISTIIDFYNTQWAAKEKELTVQFNNTTGGNLKKLAAKLTFVSSIAFSLKNREEDTEQKQLIAALGNDIIAGKAIDTVHVTKQLPFDPSSPVVQKEFNLLWDKIIGYKARIPTIQSDQLSNIKFFMNSAERIVNIFADDFISPSRKSENDSPKTETSTHTFVQEIVRSRSKRKLSEEAPLPGLGNNTTNPSTNTSTEVSPRLLKRLDSKSRITDGRSVSMDKSGNGLFTSL